ncbi:AI-2E family transporter [Anaplasma platys]|uniref:AI-2E family transporter n=1 Tax=Anaplasma platys TaxID=949 RepID=A0A858PYX6_9RICK|nr:AI-2E family transporter [Anaplasma platys]
MKYVNFSLIALAFVVLAVVARPVLPACCVAIVVAYLLNPVVNRLEVLGCPRMFSSFAIIISGTGILGSLLLLLIPILYTQTLEIIKVLVETVPFVRLEGLKSLLNDSSLSSYKEIVDSAEKPWSLFSGELFRGGNAEFLKLFHSLSGYFGKAVVGLANSGMGFGVSVVKVFVTLLLSFYMLGKWPVITRCVTDLVPRHYLSDFSDCMTRVDEVISAYLHGMILVCLVLSCYYCLCFFIVDLDYSLVLGVMSGLAAFVPYVGPLLCAVLVICVAVSQSLGMAKVSLIGVMLLVGHVAESNFITPLIVGRKLSLSPAWLIIGMVVLSSHLGFLGTLMSVPITATIGVLAQLLFKKYTQSSFYKEP